MEFRCERDTLLDALKSAGRGVRARGGSLPVLSCLHLILADDTLTVEGTDLETAIAVDVTVGGMADGALVVPAKILTDVVASLPPGAVTITTPELGTVHIAAGRSSFDLRSMNEDEFPRLDWPDGPAAEVPAKELLGVLRRIAPMASGDDSRPILCGVRLERVGDKLRVVATDSYRLGLADLPYGDLLPDDGAVLIPADALDSLAKVAKGDAVLVRFSGASLPSTASRQASFECAPLRLSTRLIEGEFPKYGSLVPTSHAGRLVVGREHLLDVVKRAAIMARESTPVRLKLGGGADNLLGAVTQDVGSVSVEFDAGYEGPELELGFNPHYLADALEAVPADEVWLDVTDGKKPAVLKAPGDDSCLVILMPVRVS